MGELGKGAGKGGGGGGSIREAGGAMGKKQAAEEEMYFKYVFVLFLQKHNVDNVGFMQSSNSFCLCVSVLSLSVATCCHIYPSKHKT